MEMLSDGKPLNFLLPDFVRVAWASEFLRVKWAPLLLELSNLQTELEWQSVVEGVRRIALVKILLAEYLTRSADFARLGLSLLVLECTGVSSDKQSVVLAIANNQHDLLEFSDAWRRSDDLLIGELLGYPKCCLRKYSSDYANSHQIDPTWKISASTDSERIREVLDEHTVVFKDWHWTNNILLRRLRVGAIPHIPCSFHCQSSNQMGIHLLSIGETLGYAAQCTSLRELLAAPMEWSALHGIAEIKTPFFKMSTRTDATGHKLAVRLDTDWYPHDGIRGSAFPYRSARMQGNNGLVSIA